MPLPSNYQPPLIVSRPFFYLPDGWDTVWKSAKANAATAFASVMFLGDSLTQGYASTNYMTKGTKQLIRAALIARGLPLGGDFYGCWDSLDYDPLFTGTPPWVCTSVARTWLNWGFPRIVSYIGVGVGSATLVTPYACTEIDILWYDHTGNAAAGWQYTVDGGAAVNVAINGNKQNKRIVLTGLSNAVHTIVLFNEAGTNQMLPHGCAMYPSAAARSAGIGYGHLAASGLSMGQMALQGAGITDFLRQFAGWAGAGTANTGFGFPFAPSLLILALGVNDLQNMYGIDGYLGGLRRAIQAARQGTPNCSILLVAHCNPDQVNSDVTSNRLDNSNSWHLYVEAMAATARAYRCAFLDIHAKWGENPVAAGLCFSASQMHPTDAGMADVANTILTVI